MNSLTHWNRTGIFCCYHGNNFFSKAVHLKANKAPLYWYAVIQGKKYLSKLKQREFPDAFSKDFLFKCLSVMGCEKFIVSIVELIILLWQQILLFNFHNIRVMYLFYHFSRYLIHILHGLESISIFDIWKLWLVKCDLMFGETSLIFLKISGKSSREEILFGDFLTDFKAKDEF